jgi:hypothetical protein
VGSNDAHAGIGSICPTSTPVQLLECLRVGDDVDAAANKEVPRQFARRRIVHHLVDAHLVGACAALEKEVVQQIELRLPLEKTFQGAPIESTGRAAWPLAMK